MLHCDFYHGVGSGKKVKKVKGTTTIHIVLVLLYAEVSAVILWVNVVTIWLFQPLDAHFL